MSWFPQPLAYRSSQSTRGTAPVIGGLLVVALTVILATVVGTAMLGGTSTPEPAPTAAVDLSVEGDTLRFTHESGEPLDVRTLSVWIAVDGEPLDEQPPVPFFSATRFEPGPTGPFNTASDPEWSVGETASLTVAGTNSPQIEPGSTVSVRLTTDGKTVINTETQV
jgi:Protein of unknown function (DUF1628).